MSLVRALISKLQSRFGGIETATDVPDSGKAARLSNRPTRSFNSFFDHLKTVSFEPDFCIDVGAAKGTLSIYEAFPSAKHIVFEPLPDFHAALSATLEPYDAIIKHCALSDAIEERTLLRHSDLFGSTIMHARKDDDDRVVTVQASTLDVEVADVPLSSGIVLLKIDCQGSDLMVLKGGTRTLENCDIVIVEASLFRFWGPHQPDFYDIAKFMHDAGFALYDVLDGLYRPRDSALGQLDLVFVKEKSSLRAEHYW